MTGGARGAGLAVACALLTAAGHVAGGGTAGDLGLLVVLLPLLGGVLVGVADRTRGPLGLLAVLGGGQLALHVLLELLHPAHAAAGPGPLGPDDHLGGAMIAAHALVTVLLAVAVRGADAAVAAVGAALRRVLPRRTGPVPVARPLAVTVPAGPAAGLRPATALCSAGGRRGPPVRC